MGTDAHVSRSPNFTAVSVDAAMRQHPLILPQAAILAHEPLSYRRNGTLAHPPHRIPMALPQNINFQDILVLRGVGETWINVYALRMRLRAPPRPLLEKPCVASKPPKFIKRNPRILLAVPISSIRFVPPKISRT